MTERFEGFSPGFFRFFEELIANNNREWFNANKARYEQEVLLPLSAFVSAMAPGLAKISPHYVADPRPRGGSVFRIYRDLRFAKGGKPYKEHGACQFRHERGKDAHAPGYYVHLQPDKVLFGGGIWKPPSPELKKIREAIANKPKDWEKILKDRKIKNHFGGIHGDGLTRAPRGFDPAHPHIDDIKRQTFFLMREVEPTAAQRKDFVRQVETSFGAATPMMRFLTKAVDAEF